MSLIYKAFVPMIAPSTNQIYAGSHWTKRAKLGKSFRQIVKSEMQGIVISTPVDLEFVPILGKNARTRDTSNYSYTAKLIEDGLVKAGVLADDAPEYVNSIILRPRLINRQSETGMWVLIKKPDLSYLDYLAVDAIK